MLRTDGWPNSYVILFLKGLGQLEQGYWTLDGVSVSLYGMIINKLCLREFTYCLHTTYMIDIDLLRFARNQLYKGLAISVVHAGFLCFLDFHNKTFTPRIKGCHSVGNLYTTEETLFLRWKRFFRFH